MGRGQSDPHPRGQCPQSQMHPTGQCPQNQRTVAVPAAVRRVLGSQHFGQSLSSPPAPGIGEMGTGSKHRELQSRRAWILRPSHERASRPRGSVFSKPQFPSAQSEGDDHIRRLWDQGGHACDVPGTGSGRLSSWLKHVYMHAHVPTQTHTQANTYASLTIHVR